MQLSPLQCSAVLYRLVQCSTMQCSAVELCEYDNRGPPGGTYGEGGGGRGTGGEGGFNSSHIGCRRGRAFVSHRELIFSPPVYYTLNLTL